MKQKPGAYLKSVDTLLAPIIDSVGELVLKPKTDYFYALTESIISQQLSIKAADTIFGRFINLFPDKQFPDPELVLNMSDIELRSAGLSFQKISYIKDLAYHVKNNLLLFEKLPEMTDEDVILHLTAVKGIGRWTAEMFLMFTMGRPDIFSYGDLGLKNAIKKLYKLRSHPSQKQAEKISKKWQPFRTYACRYLWKCLEF